MRVTNLPYGLLAQNVRDEGVSAIRRWLDHCRAYALDGVEIAAPWLRDLSPGDMRSVQNAVQGSRLAVSCLNVWNFRTNRPAGAERTQATEEFVCHAGLAQAFGATHISVDGGAWGGFERYEMSRREAIDRTVATIAACVPIAQAHGLIILVENHCGWLTRYLDALLEILRQLPPPHVMLNLDTVHMYREGQHPEDFLQQDTIVSRVRYLHLKPVRFEPDMGEEGRKEVFEEGMFFCFAANVKHGTRFLEDSIVVDVFSPPMAEYEMEAVKPEYAAGPQSKK